MAVLLGLYYLLFEREKMHRFNRFYLLSALVFSLAIPFITVYTFIEYVEIPEMPQVEALAEVPHQATILIEEPVNYWPYIGWGLYAIVSIIMMVRFAKNIFYFIRKANNPKSHLGKAKLVLLDEKVLPHTFLNYIFVNREDHEEKQIEDELYTHEYTHVRQMHTLDILLIEALRIVFWFNPLLYFYKRAIQLNHEFLADEKVIDANTDTIQYQTLLLSKAQHNTSFAFASQLTFSLTKKRLIMMTKTTSATKALLLKSALLPVAAGFLMLFCTTTIAQIKTVVEQDNEKELKAIYGNTHFRFTDANGVSVDKNYNELSAEEKKSLTLNPAVKADYIEITQSSADQMEKNRATEQLIITQTSGSDKVYSTEEVSTSPSYPDGVAGFHRYIAASMKVPAELKGEVKMIYSFVVEKNGTISNVKAVKDAGHGTAEQMKEILEGSAKWTPGKKEGENVRTLIVVPVTLMATKPKKVSSWEEAKEYLQEDELVPYNKLTKQPEYPGGIGAFFASVSKNFNIPETATGTYKLYFSFIVEKNGTLTNIKAQRSPDETLSAEGIRVISKSEKWKPGEVDGKAVRTQYNIPLTINAYRNKAETVPVKVDPNSIETVFNLQPGKYNISITGLPENTAILIHDRFGEKVKTAVSKGKTTVIDINKLPAGEYFIKTPYETKKITKP